MMARSKKQPLSISKIARQMAGTPKSIAVCVGTVTDDVRMLETPKLTVCATHVTAGARARIIKAGGAVITFDQLALKSPTGAGTVLLQGKHTPSLPSVTILFLHCPMRKYDHAWLSERKRIERKTSN
jgi:large subunit ribosomal protein L18e